MARHGGPVVLGAGEDEALVLVPSPEAKAVPVGTHGAQVWGLSLVAGGATAVTAGLDGVCRAWDLDGGGEQLTFPGDGPPLPTYTSDPSRSRVPAAPHPPLPPLPPPPPQSP